MMTYLNNKPAKTLFLLILLLAINGTLIIAQPTDASLITKMKNGKMPGASFAAVKDGKLIYHKNLGLANITTDKPIDDQTIFMQASVSKTMIATAIMQLWEKQKIDLDIDVNHYLPFSVRTPSFKNDSITARMLLTHTSAIQDEWNTLGSLYVLGDSPISLSSFMQKYFTHGATYYKAGNFYTYRPGTQYNYSNIGSTLAAYLVETITGDDFSHYCDTAIFQKLCITNTSFLLSGISDTTRIARPYGWDGSAYWYAGLYGYPDYPDGQLRTTSTDLSRFMTMYLQHGTYEGSRVLDSTTVDYMLRQQTLVEPAQGIIFYSAKASNGDVLWGHNGGDAGVNTAMYFNMTKKTGAIAMTNGDGTSSSNADLLVNTLYIYGITVTPDSNDVFLPCEGTAASFEPTFSGNMTIYPNPSDGRIYVVLSESGDASISDIHGKVVLRTKLENGQNEVILPENCAAGIYILSVISKNGKERMVRKISVVK
ncbi:MAG: serine hydrolase [Saprospiraceae bacterium]|nr:serine hydrolase [Candidatus Brachybacter algidus]MBL0120695.1 serine hydrolase [Candidatus Brachybacter algidus]